MSKFFAVALSGLIFFACAKESNDSGKPSEGVATNVEFTLKAISTYADGPAEDGTPAENKINHIEFYIFNADGTPDGQSPYYKHIPTTEGEKVNILVNSGNGKQILVAVNANLDAISGNFDFVKKTISNLELDDVNSRTAPSGGFHMSGETKANIIAGDAENRVTIRVSRLMSKIYPPNVGGIVVDLDPEDQEGILPGTNGETVTFDYEGFVLINGIDKSDAFTYWNAADDEDAVWNLWVRKSYLKTLYDATGENITKVYSGQINGDFWQTSTATTDCVYVYENYPEPDEIGGVKGSKPNTVYAMLIKGTLKAGTEEATRYWRVDLIKDEYYRVLRNAIYKVTIDRITTPGFGTPKEAEEEKPIIVEPGQTGMLVTIDIEPWRVKLQTTDM